MSRPTDPSPSWPLYREVVFLCPVVPRWASFAIVTACNPLGVRLEPEANDARDRALHAELLARGLAPLRIVGCSRDLAHREPGWAFPVERAAAVELGVRHTQEAVYLVEHGELLLVSCPPRPSAEERLGAFAPRVIPDVAG